MKIVILGISLWIHLGLAHVCDIVFDAIYSRGFANCSCRQLTKLPSDLPQGIEALDISRNELVSLTNFTFIRYTHLTYLNLRENQLSRIETDAFYGLIHLSTLLVDRNNFGILNSLNMLKPLIERNMTTLDLSEINSNSNRFSSYKITKHDTKYLTQMCIKKFFFQKNYVVFIEDDAFFGEPFVSCVEALEITGNNILGSIKILFQLFKFTRLKVLKMSNRNLQFALPTQSEKLLRKEIFQITLPPTLEYLDVSKFGGVGEDQDGVSIIFINATNLKTFKCAYIGLPNNFTMFGLENLERLDMSGTNLASLSYSFFEPFLNLKVLSVRKCNLWLCKDQRLRFPKHSMLQSLDISQNFISEYPDLPNPFYVKELNLSGNTFIDIPFDLTPFVNLITLDMSFNHIAYLRPSVRKMLDEAFENRNLLLALQGNVFSCSCENLEFVLWLTESPVISDSNRNFSCIQDDGSMTGVFRVARNIVYMRRHCNGKLILILTITFASILLSSLVVIYALAKNSTRYKNAILRYIGLKFLMLTPADFKFKFYVGYCEANIQFVYQSLRPALELCNKPVLLFLKDREVLPGVDIADGIVAGITNSWKTMLVVSHDFLEDQWSNFTINTAVYSMTDRIPDRIIVLLVDDIQVKDLPESLLNAVDENYIFHLRDFEKKRDDLWKRFRDMNEVY